MQLFGTSLNLEVGPLRLRLSFGLDDRTAEAAVTRVEDMPRLEFTK
jgi:hypothetical protein